MRHLLIFMLIGAIEPLPRTQDVKKPRLVGSNASSTTLIVNTQVRNELKLTADQVVQCEEIRRRFSAKSRTFYDLKRELEGQPPTADETFNSFLQCELTDELGKILTGPQLTRFMQINFQMQGPNAYLDRHTRNRLAISREQAIKLDEIKARLDARTTPAEVIKLKHPDRKSSLEWFEKLKADFRRDLLALLSEDQKRLFQEMEGPKFTPE